MINRILIRIKVVQILYSYFLVEKKFTLAEPPATPTREKRFAYQAYIDMLTLMAMTCSEIASNSRQSPILRTRFLERIDEDDRIGRGNIELRRLAAKLAPIVKESGAYKIFTKEYRAGVENAEDAFWDILFNQILLQDPDVKAYIENAEGYTLKGFERLQAMMEDTLHNFMTSQDSLSEALLTLSKSLDAARNLYMRLLALAIDLTDLRERQVDAARYKHLATDEDLNPNLKFVENEAIDMLRNSEVLQKYIKDYKINWTQEKPLLIPALMKAITESEPYKEYMANPERGMKQDADLWKELFRKVILVNTSFLEMLEDKSVFWNDDLDVIGDFAVKTFRRIEEGEEHPVLDQYKDTEDAAFGSELMRAVFKGREQYREWIREAVADSQWEADRLAFMDVVVIITALAEIMNFPKIPLTVSINEYIEIAKCYSSAKSGQFVHGLLAHIIAKLQEEKQLMKQ